MDMDLSFSELSPEKRKTEEEHSRKRLLFAEDFKAAAMQDRALEGNETSRVVRQNRNASEKISTDNEKNNQVCMMDYEVKPKSTGSHLLQWSQWQLLDSILPTGGFAHSYGLEAAIQTRLVAGPEDLRTHVIHVLDVTGSLLLPFVHCANKFPNIDTWSKLDKWLEATLTNEVSRKASTSQGSALLRVAASVFVEVAALKQLRDVSLASGNVSFHHAPIFGLICGLLGFNGGFSQRAYMFMAMRDVLSAATRLNLVGPLGASALQHQIAPIAEQLVGKWMDRPIEEACQTVPLLDTVQGCHGYLFSRLFCS